MELKTPLALLFAVLAFVTASGAQSKGSSTPAGPPKFLRMVQRELKPGTETAYDAGESEVIASYTRENVAVYWLGLQSITGPPEALSVSLFDSTDDMGKSTQALDEALASHADIRQSQDHLLQENTSSGATVIAVKRDDMGFRPNTIDLAKTRILRVSTIFVHPGYERAFVQAEWTLSAADEKVNAQAPWAVYQVNAGLPVPTFIVLTPMRSLGDLDQALATDSALQKPENATVEEQLEELSRVAYGSVETHLFRVDQRTSHVSTDFAAGDPQFWNVAPAAESLTAAPKNAKAPPRKAPAKAQP